MSLVALLPLIAFVVGVAVVAVAVARVLDEIQQLRTELQRTRQVRPLMAEVGNETLRLRLALHRLAGRH